jgi:hypothetical protein
MSRLGGSPITVKPGPNIYTGLAFVSMLSTAGALGYLCYLYFTYFNK